MTQQIILGVKFQPINFPKPNHYKLESYDVDGVKFIITSSAIWFGIVQELPIKSHNLAAKLIADTNLVGRELAILKRDGLVVWDKFPGMYLMEIT